MIVRMTFPGGWYADARPSGAYVVLMPGSHLDTDRGAVPLPNGQNLLYVRMAPDGIRFAGAGHQDDRIWEWDGSHWLERGPAYGVSPVIYDRDGVLRINTGSWGSQGARFVNDLNWIVTADESYFSAPMELSEWTKLAPELYIGQSHPDGTNDAAWVWDRGTQRLLEPGPCRFIRATTDGAVVAIAFWKPVKRGAVFYRMTFDDLRGLPRVTFPAPQPTPVPVPPLPEPQPMPESQLDLVKSIRAKYPRSAPGSHPLGDDAWRCIVEIAQRTRTLVFRKDGGENCRIPAGLLSAYPDGVSINRTIIGRGAFGNQWVKVLGDGEGTAFPIWNVGATPADGEYVDVSEIRLEGGPPPQPEPEPEPPPPTGDLESRVRELESFRARLEAAIR